MNGIMCLVLLIFCYCSAGCKRNVSVNESDGVAFTGIESVTGGKYHLDGNIVSYNEIEGYDSANCIFLLSSTAGERIRSKNYPLTPTPFAITVDGESVYIANFIPGYSSLSCEDCITIEPYSYDNKFRIMLGYPGSGSFPGEDPRNDKRIIQRLKKDHKLTEITESTPAHNTTYNPWRAFRIVKSGFSLLTNNPDKDRFKILYCPVATRCTACAKEILIQTSSSLWKIS